VYLISEIKERVSGTHFEYGLRKTGEESSFCLLWVLCKVFLYLKLKYNIDKPLKYVIVK
jgi:hypothetical protein